MYASRELRLYPVTMLACSRVSPFGYCAAAMSVAFSPGGRWPFELAVSPFFDTAARMDMPGRSPPEMTMGGRRGGVGCRGATAAAGGWRVVAIVARMSFHVS